jgi:hypothetical protein
MMHAMIKVCLDSLAMKELTQRKEYTSFLLITYDDQCVTLSFAG